MKISEYLAEYILSIKEPDIAPEVWNRAKAHFLDGLACMYFGIDSASVQIATEYVKNCAVGGSCVFPNKERLTTDPAHCAMLCAMAAHSRDYDDMSISLNGHPSALLVPVIFSLAQSCRSDGKAMLSAYIAGVEVDAILGKIFSAGGYNKAWNPSGFIGIFGAVAAAGYLLGLDRDQLVNALGIAVNEAAGVKANFGSLAKDLGLGYVTVKAIMAAQFAKFGMTANANAFEGPFGLLTAFGGIDAERAKEIIRSHKSDFVEPGLVMKPYPSCRGNHSGIDCATAIIKEHSFSPDDVLRVVCKVDQAACDTDRYEHPQTPDQAKFSLAFCIARVIFSGKIQMSDFIGEEIKDKAALEFIDKVEIHCTPELFPRSRFGTQVELFLKDGRVFTEKRCFAKGDPEVPMSQQEIEDKLFGCLALSLGEEKARKAVDKLRDFDKAASVEEIIGAL